MNRLTAWIKSIHFLMGLQSKDETLPDVKEISIPVRNGSLRADCYMPKSQSLGTIITINGLAPLGNRDPRFIIVNKSLNKLGYTVISPFFDEICDYKISLRNIDDIKDSILFISGQKDLCTSGKVSIFAPSFSGSLSLIAVSDKQIADRMNTICAIGAFANVDDIIGNLFADQNLDEYGRMILLLNFLPLSIGENKSLFKAIKLAILDNYFKYKDNLLEPHFSKMKKVDRDFFENLKYDKDFRMKHWNIILKKSGKDRELLSALSVTNHINSLNLPILLIHGLKDDVVPANESSMLHEELVARGVECKLCITSLISHGDTGFSLKTLLEVPKLITSFSFFFRKAYDKKQ
ncbi:alpha/beta hydrolase family protein [Leptospira vanthielii]|uniref:Peptidase, S9A/B/C family, catalytic domain protein n=1 Tax=Leptospira vanthielii serovar Holland str. Waz Holland = ATCC 700522 TaxID=1218591 RepID=N1WF34_9LEPT|nr:prolyl oligopeptidase family serine peptidase [Leptospira vanthielii]EMY70471.1 peptidase, S9A/B/C family, catalytic domain protein [Leptospira vanthielii serovar Holland str. Waz Holland = ATCC 700522]